MRNFDYTRARSLDDAVGAARDGARILGGGTTTIDLMKLDVAAPAALVDVTGVAGLDEVRVGADAIRLGATARMQAVADHADLRATYPALSDALSKAASPQVRAVATLGGNLLQRTRCPYFRDTHYVQCNKRDPGSGCAALDGGEQRMHAVLGTSPACIAAYPGDFAATLVAFDASVIVDGDRGRRRVMLEDLHLPPGEDPSVETTLEAGDVIVAIEVPRHPAMVASTYLKARDRNAFAFATASAAVGVAMEGETVADVRVALGGVATTPWRSRGAEEVLRGQTFSQDRALEAGGAAFAAADAPAGAAYKVALGASVVTGALMAAHAQAVRGD